MYLMLTDETNNTPVGQIKFFVYGGLIIPLDQVEALTAKIKKIRQDAGYESGDVLKFDTNARPQHIDHQTCTKVKKRVIEACKKCGCRFIAYLILHDIAKSNDPRQLVTWAADHVIGRFNYFLTNADTTGICIIDSLPVDRQFQYLSDKFCNGLQLEGKLLPLDRIQLFAATVINASHLSSAMDIVLGSFRYAINDPPNDAAAKDMMKNVARLMWYREHEGNKYIGERGIVFRPIRKNIRVSDYRQQYDDLEAYLQSLIKDVE